MRSEYKRDPFVTAWDLNHSCRDIIVFKKGSKGMFARMKKYARKRQRTEMKRKMMEEEK